MIELVRPAYESAVARTDFLELLAFSVLLVLTLLVSIVNPYWGVVALVLLIVGFALNTNLKWGTLFLVFLLPFDPQIELGRGSYVYFDLLFILPALVYLWRVVFRRIPICWPALSLAPYLLFAVATSFWRAENLYWFSGYAVRLLIAVMFMGVVAGVANVEKIVLVLGITLIPQVLYGLYQLSVGSIGFVYSLIYPHYQDYVWTDRARGFFFTENNFGTYCATILVMLLALALRSKSQGARIVYYILSAFGLVGLAAAGSRGAWLGAVAGTLLLFFYSRASWTAKLSLAGAAAVVALMIRLLQYTAITRVGTLDTLTIEGRSTMYLAALLLFVQHPVIGVGLTNYQVLMSSVVDWMFDSGNAAHNTYLQILSENGLTGFVLFFGPLFYTFYRNLRKAKESTVALLCSAGLIVFFVHGLFDFQFTTAPQYLLLFAVLYGLSSRHLATSDSWSEVS